MVVGPATEAYAAALRSAAAGGSPCGSAGWLLCYFSTWQADAASPVALAYAAANFTLVLSPPPLQPGWHNVNLQLASTHAGLRAAAAAGATHALKMRGDVHVTSALALLRDVVTPAPARLHIVSWIGYLTEYLVAGPLGLMLELFSPQQAPTDDRFAELFMMEEFAARRNQSHQALCRSTARWADAAGRPAGGAPALPEGLLYWKCEQGALSPACDLAVGLRRYVAPEDACNKLLPPGCNHAC